MPLTGISTIEDQQALIDKVNELDAVGGGVPEAPMDGATYARQMAAWVETLSADAIYAAPPNDTVKTAYWADVDLATPRIWRVRERMFIGNAALHHDNRAGANSTWLPNGTAGPNWLIRDGQLVAMNERGAFGVVGLSRASDGDDLGNISTIGVAGFVLNNANTARSAWAFYADIQHQPAVPAMSFGFEVAAKNKGGDYTDQPYQLTYGVKGLWLAGGGDEAYGGVNTNNPNTAIVILKNFRPWNRGIVIEADGLAGTDGVTGTATAIAMARGHRVSWYYAGGNVGASIRSDVDAGGVGSSILFANNAIQFFNAVGVRAMQIGVIATAANFVNITQAAAASPPVIAAAGTDTHIDLRLEGKGTGVVRAASNISVAKTDPAITLIKTAAAQTPGIYGQVGTTTPLTRWGILLGDSTAESGSNVGSDFKINSYNDAGSFVEAPIVIARSSGITTFNRTTVFAKAAATNGNFAIYAVDGVSRNLQFDGSRLVWWDVTNDRITTTAGAYFTHLTASTGNFTINGGALKPGGGAWADSSDERIKNIEGDYAPGLNEIAQLRPVYFTFKGNDTSEPPKHDDPTRTDAQVVPYDNSPHTAVARAGKHFVGLIAQEAEIVFPEMVTQRSGFIDGVEVADLRDIDTTPLLFALINSAKELKLQNDMLHDRIKALEAAP